VDNEGRPDVFLTALENETCPLYRNLGKGLFAYFTYRSRVGAASVTTTGWGAGNYGFNNDGRKDLFCTRGDRDNLEALNGRAARQRNPVLAPRAKGTFEPVAIPPEARHRGAAFADFDPAVTPQGSCAEPVSRSSSTTSAGREQVRNPSECSSRSRRSCRNIVPGAMPYRR
jgi:hypothetical protein